MYVSLCDYVSEYVELNGSDRPAHSDSRTCERLHVCGGSEGRGDYFPIAKNAKKVKLVP